MSSNKEYSIAVIPGDGIGVEVTDAAFAVAEVAIDRIGNFSLSQQKLKAGTAQSWMSEMYS